MGPSKYVNLLYEEFKNANGYNVDSSFECLDSASSKDVNAFFEASSKEAHLFRKWLLEQRNCLEDYARFLEEDVLSDEEKNGVVEVEQGILNTLTGTLRVNKTVLFSIYAHAFDTYKRWCPSLESYAAPNAFKPQTRINGMHVAEFFRINYDLGQEIPAVITQLPTTKMTKDQIEWIIKNYKKTVVVGVYGKKTDQNISQKEHTLYKLKQSVESNGIQTAQFEDYSKDNYNVAVKFFPKQKAKCKYKAASSTFAGVTLAR